MNLTAIEWTDFSANPLKYRDAEGNVVWGCVHASPGCMHCYSEQLAKRYGRGGPFNVATMQGLTPFLDEKELHHMLTAKTIKGKPVYGGKCFVGDMTDLFGEWVPFELLDRLFAVFALRSDVTWQILTKRADRALEYFTGSTGAKIAAFGPGELTRHGVVVCETGAFAAHVKIPGVIKWPIPNVWLGVSAENQQYADERIPVLLQTPAAVRFVSYEPALGPVDFDPHWLGAGGRSGRNYSQPQIDWIIVGGESGPGARPFNIQWARDVVKQCKQANVACFVKQLGAKPQGHYDPALDVEWELLERKEHPLYAMGLRDRKGGDMSEWPGDLRIRQFPEVSHVAV